MSNIGQNLEAVVGHRIDRCMINLTLQKTVCSSSPSVRMLHVHVHKQLYWYTALSCINIITVM